MSTTHEVALIDGHYKRNNDFEVSFTTAFFEWTREVGIPRSNNSFPSFMIWDRIIFNPERASRFQWQAYATFIDEKAALLYKMTFL